MSIPVAPHNEPTSLSIHLDFHHVVSIKVTKPRVYSSYTACDIIITDVHGNAAEMTCIGGPTIDIHTPRELGTA